MPDALACCADLGRCLARGRALASCDEDSELVLGAAQAFLEGAAHRRREPARVPVETENATEGLKPVRVREAPQNFVAAKFAREENHDLAGQRNHPFEQIPRSLATVQREMR